MEIAALSMSIAQANTQNAVSIGMMKKTMEASEQSMEMITDMIDSIPSPDGRGQLLNVLA